MNGETSKAFERRVKENWFNQYAPEQKSGIDIGCQNDPLNETFRRWDLIFGDGDATFMKNVPDETFQTVYASHVLEHLDQPTTAIKNWWRILKDDGYLIIIVPHRDLYERKLELPSQWNPDHKWFYLPDQAAKQTLSLKQIIRDALGPVTIQMRVLSDGWIELPINQHPVGEYSIEAIIKKSNCESC